MNAPMIHVGLSGDAVKKTLPELSKSIMQVRSSPAGDEVKKSAIAALAASCKVENLTIQDCSFNAGGGK